jgi:CRP-like cAMP-binding protein
VHAIDPGPLSNKLLQALPLEDFQLLASQLETMPLVQGTVLFEPGDEVGEVYFPLSGRVSMLVVMRDGKAIETATVGREDVVGAMAGLGLPVATVRAIVQLSMFATRISAPRLRKAAGASKSIADLCIRYNEVLLEQAQATAACNALQSIEARFCRWLLQSRDRAENDTTALTQEFLSEMLGVRRTSVTQVASKIQAAGAISYARGVIKIIDPKALKRISCECYETVREQNGV